MEGNNTLVNQSGIIVNAAYLMSLAMDRMLRVSELLMSRNRELFVREKKQLFSRYTQAVRTACLLQDMLTQDIWDMDAKHDYKNVDMWLDQSNELARLILLFADKSRDQEDVDKVFSTLRAMEGEGIVDEKLLEYFYLK